jgi:hypothetical protein
LVVFFEAFNTFPNEIVAFDNLRIGAKVSFLDADFNQDGIVNLTDFNILKGNFNKTGQTKSTGDTNGDGAVNLLDFNKLKSQFNQKSGGQAVPEPGTLALAGTALACLVALRLRRRAA